MITFTISKSELEAALKDINEAESNNFNFCVPVFKFVSCGESIEDSKAVYSDLIEKSHPTDPSQDWGRLQNISKRYKFENGKLIKL